MPASFLKSLFVFGRELVTNPKSTGAACPSSPFLANKMASFIDRSTKGWIVELGAGTGAVTQALLNHGVDPNRLISVEMSPSLASHLRERFPAVHVKQGDASELTRIIAQISGENKTQVDYIVSSLPFRSLPDEVGRKIVTEMKSALSKEGRLIQFTYDLRRSDYHHFSDFERLDSGIVLLNVPPARVDLFELSSP